MQRSLADVQSCSAKYYFVLGERFLERKTLFGINVFCPSAVDAYLVRIMFDIIGCG